MMARVLECSLAKGGHRKACKYCGELELVPSTACAVQYGEPYHARAAAVKRDPPLPHDQLGQQRLRSNPAVMRVPPSFSACAATVARTFHDSHVLPRGQVRKLPVVPTSERLRPETDIERRAWVRGDVPRLCVPLGASLNSVTPASRLQHVALQLNPHRAR
eukprot:CAMPEP_0181176576 /NCGR_PEP_ID=MMETSP1096-20121128/4703_1 /TAXON_ID=156174 ORGANISM="Chrysochromulina ericina, Strain CCMP281" /NCGR_SAMPLE_ID=MMETSP1096 /ASSEMBLY_ACC=CAM_ASM_000453 /LENGTH=160 /DNA_ID=CAMNT_0023264673 /DNA_START=472 /DNA_END=954 /DNA_ORIENTATION=+